jgi:hypothetical protein
MKKTDTINFTIAQNYPSDRRFIIRRPLKKSFKDSVKELFIGK